MKFAFRRLVVGVGHVDLRAMTQARPAPVCRTSNLTVSECRRGLNLQGPRTRPSWMVRQATRKLHASRSPSWLSLACHNQTMGAATLETQQPKTDAAGRKPKQARASQGRLRVPAPWATRSRMLNPAGDAPPATRGAPRLADSTWELLHRYQHHLPKLMHWHSVHIAVVSNIASAAAASRPDTYTSVISSSVISTRRHDNPQERSHLHTPVLAGQALTAALSVDRVSRCADPGARDCPDGRL